jgi:hypothetical protein
LVPSLEVDCSDCTKPWVDEGQSYGDVFHQKWACLHDFTWLLHVKTPKFREKNQDWMGCLSTNVSNEGKWSHVSQFRKDKCKEMTQNCSNLTWRVCGMQGTKCAYLVLSSGAWEEGKWTSGG